MTGQPDAPAVRGVTITMRVERDPGTSRRDMLASLRALASDISGPAGCGWRIVPGSVAAAFEDAGENLAAERGW